MLAAPSIRRHNAHMRLIVTAKPNSKTESVIETGRDSFAVAVKAPPRGGLANKAIARMLAGYFKIAPSRVRLISGFSAKIKVFEIA